MIQTIGTTFPPTSQWHTGEQAAITSIARQIEQLWPNDRNLLINTTWFGPQFTNPEYRRFLELTDNEQFDRVVLLATVDPVFLNPDQIQEIISRTGASTHLLIGNFDGAHQFNFISTVVAEYFADYTREELLLREPVQVYLNYNRKPREHRRQLIKLLDQQQLLKFGVVTLGHDQDTTGLILGEQPADYARAGNWNMPMTYGIPHDIHSLGNMSIWQHCFLNIVSETEFNPWDNLFVTEKTWKPIIGLRPFVINGQTTIYKWLRDHGFRTFNHYWPTVDVESAPEYQVHASIAQVVAELSQLSSSELHAMYTDMLPDLEYNRSRFFEFAREQSQLITNILCD
jgi:hypothetical protein